MRRSCLYAVVLLSLSIACSNDSSPGPVDAARGVDAESVDAPAQVTCEVTATIADVRAEYGASDPITRASGAVNCDGTVATIKVEVCMEGRKESESTWTTIGCMSLTGTNGTQLGTEYTTNLTALCLTPRVFRAAVTATIDGVERPVETSTELSTATLCT